MPVDQPQAELQRLLYPGEQILWSGTPAQGLRLKATDAGIIPFSLLWGGFAIFWNVGVWKENGPLFFKLWGLPFLVIGLYFIVGRFFFDAFIRARTVYGLTNQRVLILKMFMGRKTVSLSLISLPPINLNERADGSGDVAFGAPASFGAWANRSQPQTPVWEGIPNARLVQDQVLKAQQDLRAS